MIKVNNVSVSFGEKEILRDITMSLDENITYCVMGQSGVGKTTLLRVISGLLKPSKGSIEGTEGKKKSFVFQENRLIGNLSVYDNIKYVTDSEKDIEAALRKTGLWEEKNKLPDELSGGMARRASIARAAAFGGDIFFIDEPLYGLDVKTSEGILAFIKDTVKGKTSFIITHSPEEAFFLSGKIIFLKKNGAEIRDISEFSSHEDIKNYLINN